MKRLVRALICALMLAAPLAAQTPSLTPAQEGEAREIGRAMRCVVCQNQSIEDSDAELASDMRALVRERLAAGQSREQIIGYMRESYGDVILLKPPVQGNTYVLWAAPFMLFALAFVWLWWRQILPEVKADALTPQEREKLAQIKQDQEL